MSSPQYAGAIASNSDEAAAPPTGEMSDYVLAVWRWRRGIVGISLLAGVLAYGVSALLPRSYRAAGTVMFVESKVADGAPSRPGGDYRALQEIVRQLLVNPSTLTLIVRQTPELHGMPTDRLAAAIETRTVPYSPVVEVGFSARSPEVAQRILSVVLEQAAALNARMNRDELAASREYLRAQVEAGETTLNAVGAEQLEFNRTARLQEAREMIAVMIRRKADLLRRRDEVRTASQRVTAEVATWKQLLAGRETIVPLSRSVFDDPSVQQLVRDRSAASSALLTVRTETLDPAVTRGEQEYHRAVAEEAGSKAELAAIGTALAALERELPQLQAELAAKEATAERLQRTYDLSKETYKGFVRKYEDARIVIASRAPELKILNPAVASPVPVSPRRTLNALAAATSAFLVAVTAAFLSLTLRRARGPRVLPVEVVLASRETKG